MSKELLSRERLEAWLKDINGSDFQQRMVYRDVAMFKLSFVRIGLAYHDMRDMLVRVIGAICDEAQNTRRGSWCRLLDIVHEAQKLLDGD